MKRVLLAFATLFMGINAFAQGPMQPMPVDKDLRVGKLPNGMTYYIRHNALPKGQANFHIVSDVGAIQEKDDQQGLAHFLEHMAFNGTKNMPGKEAINYLETIGVKFGANLNAATSWDYTTYMITNVPTTRQGIIDSALLILHDWSHFITPEEKEIDAERGVIMEELRTRDNAMWRSQLEMIKSLAKGTLYEHRNLIGYLDGLKGFKPESLINFYKEWYRPDYQAVVVVGDIDVDAIEAQIKDLMGDIPAPAADASQKEVINVPNNQEPIVSVFTDPELQQSRASIFIKRPALPKAMKATVQGEMMNIITGMAADMATNRLAEIAMKPNAPILGGGSSASGIGIIPTLDLFGMIGVTKDGGLATGLETLFTELEKIRRFGFDQTEFEMVQNNMLRSQERAYINRNDRTTMEYVQKYVSNFTSGTPIAGAEDEWKLDSMLIKMVNVDMINQAAAQLITPENQVILVASPEKEGVAVPSEEDILAIRSKVMASEIEANVAAAPVAPLLEDPSILAGSPVASTKHNEEYQTTTWTLENGVKVIVRPSTLKADEVLISVSSNGGLSKVDVDEVNAAALLPAVAQFSGIGALSANDLRKALSGKSASVRIGVDGYESSMMASTSPRDLETALQLIYLNFTSPRFNQDDFNTLVSMIESQLANIESDPDYLIQKKFTETIYNNNPRSMSDVMGREELDAISYDSLPALYSKLFPGAAGFTFTIVGNVDLETLKPLVEQYIGSIPAYNEPMTLKYMKDGVVEGVKDVDFKVSMKQPKVAVHRLLTGKIKNTIENRVAMNFLVDAARTFYLEEIREKMSATYGVQIQGNVTGFPRERYNLHINCDTNVKQADEVIEKIMSIIVDIANGGVNPETTEKSREYLLKSADQSLDHNSYWMTMITLYNDFDLDYLADYKDAIKSVTNEDIAKLASKIVKDNNNISVVMRPMEE